MIYLRLFFEFFKTGLFAVGGGLATVPFLYDMADRTGWFTHSALADMIAVSESTPGAMGVNMATYVGYTTAGLLGGIIATAGLIMPSLIIIMIIAKVLEGLIAAAGFLIFRLALLDLDAYSVSGAVGDLFHWKAWLLAAVLLILTNLVPKIKKIHPVFFILASAVVGIVFAF